MTGVPCVGDPVEHLEVVLEESDPDSLAHLGLGELVVPEEGVPLGWCNFQIAVDDLDQFPEPPRADRFARDQVADLLRAFVAGPKFLGKPLLSEASSVEPHVGDREGLSTGIPQSGVLGAAGQLLGLQNPKGHGKEFRYGSRLLAERLELRPEPLPCGIHRTTHRSTAPGHAVTARDRDIRDACRLEILTDLARSISPVGSGSRCLNWSEGVAELDRSAIGRHPFGFLADWQECGELGAGPRAQRRGTFSAPASEAGRPTITQPKRLSRPPRSAVSDSHSRVNQSPIRRRVVRSGPVMRAACR